MAVYNNIPFHQPTLIGRESAILQQAFRNGNWAKESEDSKQFFKNYYPNSTCFLVNSCSCALEMAVRVLQIGEGDEVIIPGFGYVAVANAVVNNGATPVFADVHLSTGNIDEQSVAACISQRTKAVIAIHYAGNPCDTAALLQLCKARSIYLIEDAAQSIGSYLNNKPLGSFGQLACLSFDYMKNVTCGQGGLLIVNDNALLQKVQTVYDNGTNRKALLKGTQKDFDWVGNGNNCQMNPIASHFLSKQLIALNEITDSRIAKWNLYCQLLEPLSHAGEVALPKPQQSHNAHIFYLVADSKDIRTYLREHLKVHGIFAEQHYSFLPESSFGKQFASSKEQFQNSKKLSNQLLRLPLSHHITQEDIKIVASCVEGFYNTYRHKSK